MKKQNSAYHKRIKRIPLSWGGNVFTTEFPAGGAISVVGSILGGSRISGSHELSAIHADMLLEGTRLHDKKAIQLKLDDLAASLVFFAGDERSGFSARVLPHNFDALMELIAEIVREPSFPESELELYKQRSEAALMLEAQDTTRQSQIALSQALFPKGHPNYSESTQESQRVLRETTSDTLRSLHSRIANRDSLIVACAGDIGTTPVAKIIRTHFGSLPRKAVRLPKIPKGTFDNTHVTVPIEHKASIDYTIGLTTGITSQHKDFPALLLGMQILGNPGGFSGRLMQTVREQEGLTYGVYAYCGGFTKTVDGSLSVWGTFAPQLFAQGMSAIKREVSALVQNGVSEEEVQRHGDMFYSRAHVRLSTSGSFARAAHDTAAQGRELSYIDEFPEMVRSVTAKQVNSVIAKYVRLQDMSEAAAGPVEQNAFSK